MPQHTVAERLKNRLRGAFKGLNRGQQLRNLEERQSRPTKAERVVVRPDRPMKKVRVKK